MTPATPTAAAPPLDPDRPVELCRPRHAFEAHAIAARLNEEGVTARVVGDGLSNATIGHPATRHVGPQVVVRAADYEAAREVVADFDIDLSPPPDDDRAALIRRARLAFPALLAAAALLVIAGDDDVPGLWRRAASVTLGLLMIAGLVGIFRVPREE